MAVLRFDLVPNIDEPTLVLAVIGRVAAGQRDVEAISADLDRPEEQVRAALDAAAWLGLVWAGAEPTLTARGLEVAGATGRRQTQLYGEAVWRQPLAAALLRGHEAPDLALALRVLREAAPGAPELRLQRQARCLLALSLPARTHTPRRSARGGEQVPLPLATLGRPTPDEAASPVEALIRALLDHGELAEAHLPAVLAREGLAGAPLAPLLDALEARGVARRLGDGLVAAAAPASADDQPCLERLSEGGLALAFPSSLIELARGHHALNEALRAVDPAAPRLPSPLDPRRLVHGGLLAPGERPLRAVPDALSLRLRALECCPALALLGAALLLDRRAEGALHVEHRADTTLRWRSGPSLPLLDALADFAVALGHVVLRPSRGGLDGAGLASTATALGIAAWTGQRLRLDEPLFARLQRDPEAGALLDHLDPLARRLGDWLEERAPRRRAAPAGQRLFVYGSLLAGQRHAGRLPTLPRSPALARGRLWLLPEGYPALAPAPRGAAVHGELVEGLSEAQLAELDEFEEVDRGLYRRARLRVTREGRTVEAWAYVQDEPALRSRGAEPLALEDWRLRSPDLAP